jgi:hypothetical protein
MAAWLVEAPTAEMGVVRAPLDAYLHGFMSRKEMKFFTIRFAANLTAQTDVVHHCWRHCTAAFLC